jgi:hypothetical protein
LRALGLPGAPAGTGPPRRHAKRARRSSDPGWRAAGGRVRLRAETTTCRGGWCALARSSRCWSSMAGRSGFDRNVIRSPGPCEALPRGTAVLVADSALVHLSAAFAHAWPLRTHRQQGENADYPCALPRCPARSALRACWRARTAARWPAGVACEESRGQVWRSGGLAT